MHCPVYGSNQIELSWTVIPILIVVMLFLSTTRVILETEAKPKPVNALDVTVIGHQFWWEYARRLETLIECGQKYLAGILEISNTKAGLYTAAFLQNGMTSRQAESIAASHRLETRALDRFTFKRHDPRGLLLGFAAIDEKAIRAGTIQLAAALSKGSRSRFQ